jgi:hypothetical protein
LRRRDRPSESANLDPRPRGFTPPSTIFDAFICLNDAAASRFEQTWTLTEMTISKAAVDAARTVRAPVNWLRRSRLLRQRRRPVTAKKFKMSALGVEVDYTIGGDPVFPALTYKSGALLKSFKANEISSENTGLGTIVSFALIQSIDRGGERFGFFLPFINVTHGHNAHFRTVGVYEMHSGPNSVPHRPSTWRCIEMNGTAENAFVHLEEPA